MSAEPLGTVVVDEHVLPIIATRLEHGALIVTARVRGPRPAVDTLHYVVFGRDGSQIVRGSNGGVGIRWSKVGPLDELNVTVRLEVAGKLADGCAA